MRARPTMVRAKGLEPPRLSPPEPKSGVSTNFTTPASAKHPLASAVASRKHEGGALPQPWRNDKQQAGRLRAAGFFRCRDDATRRADDGVPARHDTSLRFQIAFYLITSRRSCIAPMQYQL